MIPLPSVPARLAAAQPAPAVLEVLRALDAAGHRSWIVGGAVRDLLLGRSRERGDLDVATPARPEQVIPLFRKVVPTGIDHGTVTVLVRGTPVEVTTFRGEGAYLDGRRPSSVTFLDDVDADLARRDFTVNAMAWDPLGPDFRDPFGGQDDLRRGVLRAVGDPAARFAEDGLRAMRAARFAAQLGFSVDPATAAAIPGALSVAARVSKERIAEELSRLVVAPHAAEGLALLDATGLLGLALPELAALASPLRAHAFATAVGTPPDLAGRLGALLHVLAVESPLEAAAKVESRLGELRLSARLAARAASLVRAHGCLLQADRAEPATTPSEVRRWVARIGRPLLPGVLALWRACASSQDTWAAAQVAALDGFEERLARAEQGSPPLTTGELALDGQEVMELTGVGAGPEVGAALRYLLERVLEEPGLNTRAALASELARWQAGR